MNKEAVFHINTENYIYPVSRNQLIIKIRTAKKEIKKCQVIYWNRTEEESQKTEILQVIHRDELFDYFQIKITFSQIARYQKYYFCLIDDENKTWYYGAEGLCSTVPSSHYFEYLYANVNDVISYPEWTEGTVYYQIFPERFCNGDKGNDPAHCVSWMETPDRENFMGGDLQGIIQKLSYLKELGIECIYLNPVFRADFNHKYATADYYEIDPVFGTAEVFENLVEKCHENGIKIILDGVFNHTGVHFPPFLDVLEKGEKSKYRDWFFINKYPPSITHHDYECVGAYKYMPKLNTANHEVQKFVIEVMDFWIQKYHIDGWRLDVADEVDSTLWQEARIYLKARYPDIVLIGETWGYGGRLLSGNEMDSVMNYMFRDAVLNYYALEQIEVTEFDYQINHMLALYKEENNQVMYNLIDSHDTARFLFTSRENREKLKIAAAFQILFEGSPAIYYGDERGMTGDNDPDCRRCMTWENQEGEEIFQWYQQLLSIRKKYRSIRRGDFKTVIADKDTDVYGFVRTCGQERTYVLIHKGKKVRQIACPVLETETCYRELIENKEYNSKTMETNCHFYNEDIMEYKAVIPIRMEPYSVKVITACKEEKS